MCLETDIGLLRPEPGGECLFALQTDVRRWLKVEAGCIPETGSRPGLCVAQSDAGTGSASVLCDQLRMGFKGGMRSLLDSCNNAAQTWFLPHEKVSDPAQWAQGKRIWLTLLTPAIDSLDPTLPACVSL